MRFDGYADLSGQDHTPAGVDEPGDDEATIELLQASWADDAERTRVMEPKHLAAAARRPAISEDFEEQRTATYQSRDFWPPRAASSSASPASARLSAKAVPPVGLGSARATSVSVPARISPARALPPVAPSPAAAVPKSFPVPAAVWSATSASTVPQLPPRKTPPLRTSAAPAVRVPSARSEAERRSPQLPLRATPPPLGATPAQRPSLPRAVRTTPPPISLPQRPSITARSQPPAWFSHEEFAQVISAPPPAAVAQAPLITTIFDPRQAPAGVEQPTPSRVRVIFDALKTQLASWPRARWAAVGGVALLALGIGAYASWLQRPVTVSLPDPGPTNAEIARIMLSRTGFTVMTSPPGAWIIVDGRPSGRITPERVSGLTPGLHAIELKLEGFYETSLPAVLEEGATLVLPPVRLRPLPPGTKAP
ncbi:MAG TPA: PEGA domain-containing protein [Polyangiales bacterium]|nr:PEGA domain-containing protein [Polyangiales bacterium]